MTEQSNDTPRPLADSKSGDNRFIIACVATEQSMLYCSCQARLGAIDSPGVKVPKDWALCGRHRVHGECEAAKMQVKEREAGRALFYVPRNQVGSITGAMPWVGKPRGEALPPAAKRSLPAPAAPAPKVKPKSTDVADVIGSAGTYADAINIATQEAAKPAVKPSVQPAEPPKAFAAPRDPGKSVWKPLPGETPLQTARRLAAERASA
jgi:hypothetical protein